MNHSTIRSITCRALYEASLERPVDIIDVRTVEEFRDVRAAGARNVPLDELHAATVMQARLTPATEPLYVICAVGARSAWACELMIAAGCENVVNVEGGTQEWLRSGLPVEEGR